MVFNSTAVRLPGRVSCPWGQSSLWSVTRRFEPSGSCSGASSYFVQYSLQDCGLSLKLKTDDALHVSGWRGPGLRPSCFSKLPTCIWMNSIINFLIWYIRTTPLVTILNLLPKTSFYFWLYFGNADIFLLNSISRINGVWILFLIHLVFLILINFYWYFFLVIISLRKASFLYEAFRRGINLCRGIVLVYFIVGRDVKCLIGLLRSHFRYT